MQSSAVTQDADLIGAAYSNGPINARVTTPALAPMPLLHLPLTTVCACPATTTWVSPPWVWAIRHRKQAGGVKDKQWILGVAAPFGPVTVGANYTNRSVTGGLKVKSWDLGVGYALSKRTGIQVGYQNEDSNALADNRTVFRARLLHSF
ncbi:MAG: porin [Rhodoferax sp.]|nr:porin [Rhodoferax sp.]